MASREEQTGLEMVNAHEFTRYRVGEARFIM